MDGEFVEYCKKIDIADSQKVIDVLSSFGDDKATGNRSAGSQASRKAAGYLFNKFNAIGLNNVTVDKFYSSGWTYKGANISYKDEDGFVKTIILGGYATNIEAEEEWVSVVDGGKGRISDYELLGDVSNKLVIIDINLWKDFWVNYPAYQAYLKGAKALLIVTEYAVEHESNIASRTINGPEYAHALAISKKDADRLIELMRKNPKEEVRVKFNAHSYVEQSKASYNIWGDIPGKSEEVIYMIAHYDGYYHSYFDDASGVSTILGIAKALIDSRLKLNKTIRVIAHGAEEWGKINSDYDWARGAYEQITHIHPEWAEKAFALINIDGNFPVPQERSFQILSSSELLDFVNNSTEPILKGSQYDFLIMPNNSTMSEEFNYSKAGVPCITARDSFEHSIYYRNIYHNTMDNKSFGFDRDTYKMNHILYGKILLDLDNTAIRPMDFYSRFIEMKESLVPSLVGERLVNSVNEICFYARELSLKIRYLNIQSVQEQENYYYKQLNIKLYKLYKDIQDSFVRLNWMSEVVFPHENYEKNIMLLTKAIDALKGGDMKLENVVNNFIKPIDNNNYVYDFDRRTYDFFSNRVTEGNRDTWGYHLVEKPNEDLFGVAHSLRGKFYDNNPNVELEIDILNQALSRQKHYLKEIVLREVEDIKLIINKMKKIISDI